MRRVATKEDMENYNPYADPDETPPRRKLIRVRMDEVTPRRIEWLWQYFLALGKVTLLAGDPGLGKSFIVAWIAAIVTRGWDWPDRALGCEPGNVIILSAEDSIEDTIAPRLIQANADLSRVECIQGTCYDDDEQDQKIFNVKFDTPLLVDAIQESASRDRKVKLLVIDPVSCYMDGADSNKNGDVRSALQPLVDVAEQHGIAVLMVTHLSKAQARSALAAATGSLAFGALARQAHLVVEDPDDPNKERRLLLCMKSNICRKPPGLAYVIQNDGLHWSDEEINMSADEALRLASAPPRKDKLKEATDWLLTLGLDKEPKPVKDLEAEAEAAGHKFRTVRRAFKDLGGVTFREGFQTPFLWRFEPKPEEFI